MMLTLMGEILSITEHRPWPLPAGNYVMTQRWNDLLFAHWPVPAAMLQPMLPPGLEVDCHNGEAWVSVVPFWMDRIRLRGLPELPGGNKFAELNLRTYVRSASTRVPGVYFFSLDAANPLAVLTARSWFRLPYFWANMQMEERADGFLHYKSRRLLTARPVRFEAKYRGLGRPTAGTVQKFRRAIASQDGTNAPVTMCHVAEPGSLEHFLTERYCLFTRWGNQVKIGNIHHMPWPLEEAEAEITVNELPAAFGITLPKQPPVLHYTRELVVYLWSPQTAMEPLPA
jgi:uncharacterized protein